MRHLILSVRFSRFCTVGPVRARAIGGRLLALVTARLKPACIEQSRCWRQGQRNMLVSHWGY